MRSRGDTYRSMLGYLQSQTNDKEMISRIISEVDKLEKQKTINPEKPDLSKFSTTNVMMGLILLCGGIILLFFLWGKGWVSTVPFILIGIGLAALTGIIK